MGERSGCGSRRPGVNRADLLQRMGRYPVPEGWPEDILGLEFSGVVDALGADVERWREGTGSWASWGAVGMPNT